MTLSKPQHPNIFIFSSIILVELLSFLAYFLPGLQIYLVIVAFLVVFLLSLFSLKAGIIVAMIELVIGSKGHLFSALIYNIPISLRSVIWLALMLASLIFILRQGPKKVYQEYLRRFNFWPFLLTLLAFIIFAFVNAFVRGNTIINIFNDVNAWLYLTLIIPLVLAYPTLVKEKEYLLKIFFLAITWLSVKTLFLLFIFSHNLAFMPDLYLWVRRSGIGEITAMDASWYRIFIQSQVYLPIAFFLALWPELKDAGWKINCRLILVLSLFLSVIIISMSRSFWLAFVLAAGVAAIFSFRKNWSLYLKTLMYTGLSLLLALFLIFIIVKFPYPQTSISVSSSALSERLDFSNGEAAISSRWSLLPELWQEISSRPVLGQGFGATVSYYSQDPRVLAQHPDGWYTTYAFEWAYLDTWLKLGLLGFISFLAYLFYLLIKLEQLARTKDSWFATAIAASLLFLMIVNVFTPYLNHPLGLVFLLFSSCFIQKNLL